jgi:hypothetical protein
MHTLLKLSNIIYFEISKIIKATLRRLAHPVVAMEAWPRVAWTKWIGAPRSRDLGLRQDSFGQGILDLGSLNSGSRVEAEVADPLGEAEKGLDGINGPGLRGRRHGFHRSSEKISAPGNRPAALLSGALWDHMRPGQSHHFGICPQKWTYPTAFPPGYEWRTPRCQASTGLPEKPVRVLFADSLKFYIRPWLTRSEKLMAKDSTNKIFIKDYNWLDKILRDLMRTKIREEMIERRPFSPTSAS